jgi:uncharacterized RDD family membrane protein YckC
MYTTPTTQENMLDDLDLHLVRAGAGQRFLNHLIDLISFVVLFFILGVISPLFLGIFAVPIMPAILYAVYISLLESVMKGKSFGKMVTGTRAVQISGAPITSGIAWQRGFSRIVPFEVFSALGSETNPWHDRWTDTYVVIEKESRGI